MKVVAWEASTRPLETLPAPSRTIAPFAPNAPRFSDPDNPNANEPAIVEFEKAVESCRWSSPASPNCVMIRPLVAIPSAEIDPTENGNDDVPDAVVKPRIRRLSLPTRYMPGTGWVLTM